AAAQVPLAVAVGLDVAAGESSVEAAVLTAWDAFGRVDVLINNAGVRGTLTHFLHAPVISTTTTSLNLQLKTAWAPFCSAVGLMLLCLHICIIIHRPTDP
uniref:Uncharacterized protein n=1 Tax=Aegilops tauschii subsp. strangulata TaxID=200361 RepID=A0A453DAT1_AEGTS